MVLLSVLETGSSSQSNGYLATAAVQGLVSAPHAQQHRLHVHVHACCACMCMHAGAAPGAAARARSATSFSRGQGFYSLKGVGGALVLVVSGELITLALRAGRERKVAAPVGEERGWARGANWQRAGVAAQEGAARGRRAPS